MDFIREVLLEQREVGDLEEPERLELFRHSKAISITRDIEILHTKIETGKTYRISPWILFRFRDDPDPALDPDPAPGPDPAPDCPLNISFMVGRSGCPLGPEETSGRMR